MRSWRNLKDFARAATPVTRHLSGGLRDARNLMQAAVLCAAAVNASARTYNRTPLDAPPGWLPPVS